MTMSDEFASSDDEAARRYLEYSNRDPFPNILPALLNSGDILAYVSKTGMLFPFDPKPGKLKPASFELEFLGEVCGWRQGRQHLQLVDRSNTFTFEKNSIAFVYLETHFRLPNYIAVRFNFSINHVHRGLLLGTGPLVDPGFVGRLLIPVHNLTSEDYIVRGGEGFLWVEFTKISPLTTAVGDPKPGVVEFPMRKKSLTPADYFQRASQSRPIESSIPGEVRKAQEDAEDGKRTAHEFANRQRSLNLGTAIAGIGVVIAVAGILLGIHVGLSQRVDAVHVGLGQRIDDVWTRLGELEKSQRPRDAGSTSASGASRSGQAPEPSKAEPKPGAGVPSK